MKIDRKNYQIWLIDMIDGNLNEEQASMLMAFLSDNPDIAAELDGLESVVVDRQDLSFSSKKKLLRKPGDISNQQFEFLSVASLENDLSQEQQSELEEIIAGDPLRRREFDSIQRIKLKPGNARYPGRKKLMRPSAATIGFRYITVITGVAATAALLFSLFFAPPKDINIKPVIAEAIKTLPGTKPESTAEKIRVAETATAVIGKENGKPALLTESEQQHFQAAKNITNDTITERQASFDRAALPSGSEIPDLKGIEIASPASHKTLMACRTEVIRSSPEDESGSLSRFIARNFREKVLRKDEAEETPLKGFEIAEAGVNGLNKLLGWEMAVNTTTGKTGEVESVYFSSRLLKINAPVKKP